MEHTWRWFGPRDPVSLDEVRQTGATGVVTALHEVPNGEPWTVEAIRSRADGIVQAGLRWSVVESVPVHETIRQGAKGRDGYLDAYRTTIRNLAANGIDVICYNFMPVLDWTRTELAHPLADGTYALRFDYVAYAAFDLHILRRAGARADYSEQDRSLAGSYAATLDQASRERLTAAIIGGLPGSEEHHTLETLRTALAAYQGMTAEQLRANLRYFLEAVVPVAEESGIRLAIHPDDPPWPLLGLPRIVSTAADIAWLLNAVPSVANGLTLCAGSLGARAGNDVVDMARRFGSRIYFAHLRSTRREADPRCFVEAGHLDGDIDMIGLIAQLLHEEDARGDRGPRIAMRPDHGHLMLDDLHRPVNPGYPLTGRLVGLAELRGVERALRACGPHSSPCHTH
jgi:mannonate dehydratase